ncbi:MAG: 50S ribosomal protein L3 N(5)-glutamine methyltransferase [Proteobacteria bacterium]|nr:50S ribosomal protein L3 N(5)-glutamine methyltransferase [Pseudomonadota bacterium]
MDSLAHLQVTDHLTTVGDWVRWAASRFNHAELFFGHGTENAWDEAVNLVLASLHLLPDTPKKVFHAKLLPEEKLKIFNLIQERINTRKPLAYLLKQAWFCHQPFYVDQRVLIPRSPVAEWLEKQFVPWVEPETVQHILDIGTGSGCIAIAAAWFFPHAQVDAVDISQGALEVAAINVAKYRLQDRVQLLLSDCFNQLPPKKYDIIISNPPYVADFEYNSLPVEYSHEPKNALLAGDDGLDVVRKILIDAGRYLSPGGILVLEVGNTDETFVEKFQDLPCTWLELERGGQGIMLITAEGLSRLFSN